MKDLKKLQAKQQKVQKEMEQLENRQKILLNRQTDTERRARPRRLIEHGAILESILLKEIKPALPGYTTGQRNIWEENAEATKAAAKGIVSPK